MGPGCVKTRKAINRVRTSYSFKTVSCAHIASAFNFEIEIKNIILVALRTFEFSHGLDPQRTLLLVNKAQSLHGHSAGELSGEETPHLLDCTPGRFRILLRGRPVVEFADQD